MFIANTGLGITISLLSPLEKKLGYLHLICLY